MLHHVKQGPLLYNTCMLCVSVHFLAVVKRTEFLMVEKEIWVFKIFLQNIYY